MKKVNKGGWNRYHSKNIADRKRTKKCQCRPIAANVPRPPKPKSKGKGGAGKRYRLRISVKHERGYGACGYTSVESGMCILEMKNVAYEPLSDEDILNDM
jgi:hypothetical protein